jgi:two-component system, cell cycle response regulator CpdR
MWQEFTVLSIDPYIRLNSGRKPIQDHCAAPLAGLSRAAGGRNRRWRVKMVSGGMQIFTRFLPNLVFDGVIKLEAEMSNAPFSPTQKILLAEDDNDMRRFLAKALQNAGYDVASFDNGLSAYNRLREEPFGLLLTDIVMPEMDGIELARRATEIDPDIKVMFITGFAAVALNPDNNAPRQAKILSKPFHLKDLVNEVQRLLAA